MLRLCGVSTALGGSGFFTLVTTSGALDNSLGTGSLSVLASSGLIAAILLALLAAAVFSTGLAGALSALSGLMAAVLLSLLAGLLLRSLMSLPKGSPVVF